MKKTIIYILTLILAKAALAEDKMKIKMTFDKDNVVVAELNNTKTSQDLYSKLPLTTTMIKHNNQEFYADIRLDKATQTQNAYSVGDLAYWTPGNTFVLFYNTGNSYSIIHMGKIIQGLEILPKMKNTVSVKIERLD